MRRRQLCLLQRYNREKRCDHYEIEKLRTLHFTTMLVRHNILIKSTLHRNSPPLSLCSNQSIFNVFLFKSTVVLVVHRPFYAHRIREMCLRILCTCYISHVCLCRHTRNVFFGYAIAKNTFAWLIYSDALHVIERIIQQVIKIAAHTYCGILRHPTSPPGWRANSNQPVLMLGVLTVPLQISDVAHNVQSSRRSVPPTYRRECYVLRWAVCSSH